MCWATCSSSDVVPSIRLTQVFRQAQESLIVTNAHKIRKGEFPTLVAPKERQGAEHGVCRGGGGRGGADRVVALARKSLPALGFKGDDVQVLSPLKKGSMGVDYLNLRLQEALNPADPTGRHPELLRGSRRFRIGDRVIQLVNNYDKNVFNGDVGTITDIKPDDQVLLRALRRRNRRLRLCRLRRVTACIFFKHSQERKAASTKPSSW